MQPLKVAMVDDSPTIRALVTSMIRQLGGTPLVFESALDCLQAMPVARPDLVLMDVSMGQMRGDEACQKLKAQPDLANIPVLMMTSYSGPDDARQWHRADADDFLPKPIKLAQLEAKLAAVAGAPGRLRTDRRIRVVVLFETDAKRAEEVVTSLDNAGYVVLHVRNALETRRALQQTGRVDGVLVRVCEPRFEALEAVRLAAAEFGRKVLAIGEDGLSPSMQDELRRWAPARLPAAATGEQILQGLNQLMMRAVFQGRGVKRVPFFSAVQFRVSGSDWWNSGYTCDLSVGGLRVRTVSPVEPLSPVEVSLDLGGRAQALPGLVVWSRPWLGVRAMSGRAGMGVAFNGLGAEQLALLEKAVAERTN